jgi:hypothetical protein
MSMSDCVKCWETPCVCGHEYEGRPFAWRMNLVRVAFPPSWSPSSENVRALPEPLRRYIMQLETICDPTGDVQTIWSQREQIDGLVKRVRELEGEKMHPGAKIVVD